MSDDWINCTGDVVAGDTIRFSEAVFSGGSFGQFRRPAKYLGERTIVALVLRDSYGRAKQQHTFTLQIIESTGVQALVTGEQTTRKGRNVYRNGTVRKPWPEEAARKSVADEKHARGDAARARREERMQELA